MSGQDHVNLASTGDIWENLALNNNKSIAVQGSPLLSPLATTECRPSFSYTNLCRWVVHLSVVRFLVRGKKRGVPWRLFFVKQWYKSPTHSGHSSGWGSHPGLRCTPPWSEGIWRSRLSCWSTLGCRAWRWTTFAIKTSKSFGMYWYTL